MIHESLSTDHAERAQRTIGKIDELAKSAAKLCSKNPLGALEFLGTLRGKLEGLRSDVQIVVNERDAYYKLASESLTDARYLEPMTNLEAMVKERDDVDQTMEADYYWSQQSGHIIYE